MTQSSAPIRTETGNVSFAGDAGLIARIAEREESAFREVIEAHADRLHRIAYRMMGNRAGATQDAEDLAQEALLRLWDCAPRLSERAGLNGVKLGPWLKRVTVNLAIDRLRLAKRLSGEEPPEKADSTPLADAKIEASEETAQARALIANLPERQRAAIVLTYYEELPNADAAGLMDMNIKAFESLLHRARGALRKSFEAHNKDNRGVV